MALISKKKEIYPISENLRRYLVRRNRERKLPVAYDDLQRYDNAIPLYDSQGNDTHWETCTFANYEVDLIHQGLKTIYSKLKSTGDPTVMEHLYIDRIDLGIFGNTQPFRVRVVNKINDLFDYFYVKRADASRVYGLELEHLLSPNRINFLTHKNTLIEEHIVGIPGDQFMKYHLKDPLLNEVRLAKEFVKFNERCLARLLGDMHSSNFVIDITPDFDEVHYRIRSIDFDQQSYEGRRSVYMPKYYKQNNPIIDLGIRYINPKLSKQYVKEELSLIVTRLRTATAAIRSLVDTMSRDVISKPENVKNLREELSEYYQNSQFMQCQTMGELVRQSLVHIYNTNK